MSQDWHYAVNQFLSATRSSYKNAFLLSNFHNAALEQAIKDDQADADYTLLRDYYQPAHQKFVKSYTKWDSTGGNRQSETLNVNLLLDDMTDNLDEWEPDILESL